MAKPTRCERCGRDNDPALASCVDCGAPLGPAAAAPAVATCSACGAPLRPEFRFCGGCGTPVAGAKAPAPAPPPIAGAPPARFRLVAVRTDGLPGSVFPLVKDDVLCGRTDGDIRIPDDATVSPRHARFVQSGGSLRVDDLGSVNGTYLRIREPRRLAPGQEIRIGHQLLRLEPLARAAGDGEVRPWGTRDPGYRFRLSQLLEGGGLGEIFPLREGESSIGREAGEITFPGDLFVSARHARIHVAGDEVTLADDGSSNGTFLKIARSADVSPGDLLLVGAQLVQVE